MATFSPVEDAAMGGRIFKNKTLFPTFGARRRHGCYSARLRPETKVATVEMECVLIRQADDGRRENLQIKKKTQQIPT